jgi:peroxiredoxin
MAAPKLLPLDPADFKSPTFQRLNLEGFTHLSGEPFDPASLKGKRTLLIFWAAWCPYCRLEMPGIEELASKLQRSGIELLTVSCGDNIQFLKAFISKNNYTFRVVLDAEGILKDKYSILLPTAFLLNTKRKAVAMIEGTYDWSADISLKTLYYFFENLKSP